jgi:hypothetical protein
MKERQKIPEKHASGRVDIRQQRPPGRTSARVITGMSRKARPAVIAGPVAAQSREKLVVH